MTHPRNAPSDPNKHGRTIAAIATPPGAGGVGIIRISGPEAKALARVLFRSSTNAFSDFTPRMLHHGHLLEPRSGLCIDEVLVAYMPGPRSYTGEDVVEINCHGGPAILAAALEALFACGALAAEKGEFTKRAFLNGRLDLTQAEAVAEAIAAPSREGLRLAQAKLSGKLGQQMRNLRAKLLRLKQQLCLALDFPEDEVEEASPEQLDAMLEPILESIRELIDAHARARAWREGALAVLAGHVNAGKSSLLNALLGFERAIVTEIPGTTRDYLEEPLLLDGLPLRLVDTAGLRETGDIVERHGLAKSRDLASQADLVLFVHDASLPLAPDERELLAGLTPGRVLALCNKCDLASAPAALPELQALGFETLRVSAATGEGMELLAQRLRDRLSGAPPAGDLAPNLRQTQALKLALAELAALRTELHEGQTYDLLDVRLEAAMTQLDILTGAICPDEVLNAVFDQFCIGK